MLSINPAYKLQRRHFLSRVSRAKLQLAHAYASEDKDKLHPHRIRRAKLTLVRMLLELHGSPELGPPYKFSWGPHLTILFKHGVDNEISWAQAAEATTWFAAASLIESSLGLSSHLQYPDPESDPSLAGVQELP